MPVKDALPAVLRGDLGADLQPSDREALETLAHDAQSEGEKRLNSVRDELAGRLRQADPPAPWGVSYLLAAVCALHGEVERAQQTLLQLGEKVAAKKKWEPLAAIAERSLSLVQSQAAAHMLVQAHEGLGKDPERIDALSRAWAVAPDDLVLAQLLAKRLGEAGRAEDRRALLGELAERFAAEGLTKELEAATIELASADDWEGLIHCTAVVPVLAGKGSVSEAQSIADLALEGLARCDKAGEVAEALRRTVALVVTAQGETAADGFRGAVAAALRQGPGRLVPAVDDAIAQSGLTDDAVPLPKAIEAFDVIASLAPGRGVLHTGFGPGRIVSNDTVTVVVDFLKSKGNKMPYAAARRTLTPAAEDDVRLMRFTQPSEVLRLRNEDQGGMVVAALRCVGGAADANRLKLFLISNELVPAKDWTVFWRKAKSAAEKDPRIDHARAFEGHYRLAPEPKVVDASVDGGDDSEPVRSDVPLPGLEVRKPARTNLATLRKFLSQHPDAEKALAGRFFKFVERTMLAEDGDLSDRARAGLYFVSWKPERRDGWIEVVRALWNQGVGISHLSYEDEQLRFLADSSEAGFAGKAILSALDSRFAAVREAAEKSRATLDDAGKAEMRKALVDQAVVYPAAALRLIEEAFTEATPPEDSWRLFAAALQLIEDKCKDSVGQKVLKWIGEGGQFAGLLKGIEPPNEIRLKLRVLLRQWRSSDRYLFPALDAVAALGLPEERDWVMDHRKRKAEALFSQVGEAAEDFDASVMTRITRALLQKELDEIERELKTTIPQAIQKARELGDLKENAEYHAAKDKQATYQKRASSLQLRISRARFVEDADWREGVAGLGMEVALEADGEKRTYWILGDGEHHLGDTVISHQAPIGRALLGRVAGDTVELGEGAQRRSWRVNRVTRRLPADASSAS